MTVEEVEEGSEPAEFIKALGPQDKKAYDCMLQGASSHSQSSKPLPKFSAKNGEKVLLFFDCLYSVCEQIRKEMCVCVVSRSREVQLHTPAVLAERQLRDVRRGGAAVSSQGDGGSHGDALPAGEPLLRTTARYHTQL